MAQATAPGPASAPREDAAAAAARLVAALRTAALWAPSKAARAAAEEEGQDRGAEGLRGSGSPVIGEMLVRVTARAALPLLPEPPSPARDAFAEAIIALRAGLRGSGRGTTFASRS